MSTYARRCSACNRPFIAHAPHHRLCDRCWSARRDGFSAAWLAEREHLIGVEVDLAVARDDEREAA